MAINASAPAFDGTVSYVGVQGFRSIARPCGIAVAPLTILAGANGSGKSSMLQPLLLIKQTLEATYDPGPLLVNGPCVQAESGDKLLSRAGTPTSELQISVGVCGMSPVDQRIRLSYVHEPGRGFHLAEQGFSAGTGERALRPGMPAVGFMSEMTHAERAAAGSAASAGVPMSVTRARCFLQVSLSPPGGAAITFTYHEPFERRLRGITYLPGLRGLPQRTYPRTAAAHPFSGPFSPYTAAVIESWQDAGSADALLQLGRELTDLGLTWTVAAEARTDTSIELQVGRLLAPSRGGNGDMVSIADTGVGIWQVLPVLVALRATPPGDMVLIEQPELHLHPRAQVALASILVDAANRGVRVVAETHSSLLLLGIQTAVAEGAIRPDDVAVHWFQRDTRGITKVTSAVPDDAGRLGEWPEDFADVALNAQGRYLDAHDAALARASGGTLPRARPW